LTSLYQFVKKRFDLGYILAGVRALLLIIILCFCLIPFLISEPFVRDKANYARIWRQFYCRVALFVLGCKVNVNFEDEPIPKPYLAVSNHISFSDPLVTLAYLDGMPIAKAEIRKYPIIGYAALKTGIIYVKREEKWSRMKAREAIKNALEEKRSVLVYPEGTISHSPHCLRKFSKGVFYSAIENNAPIVLIALKYHSNKSWWNPNRGLISHFFIQFGVWKQEIEMSVSSPKWHKDGREASIKSRNWIQDQLGNPP